ncbi:MAG: twin-arginine translocase TatA/TatE family subunit [Candidatus Rokubacteria bacterium]|nr:twin-arginine translocase TatA/TatE family subunit [Candidatus Rokubacteria bacterium]
MLLIGVLALLVFGPTKLPELGRMMGRAMREFRRASDEFRSTVETNLHINDPDPIPQPPVETPVEPVASPASDLLPSELEEARAADTTAVAADTPGEPFCAQRGSRLFHRRECTWVPRIPEADRVYLKSVTDARDQGFSTCPVCEPWEPA